MKISVIIPVYNAAQYVRQAVESALDEPETGEVILVEDGSPDDSLEVCYQLAEEYGQVRLFTHADGRNHGAGATRNLGIDKALYEHIAFLDSDDFFLPYRFKTAIKVLSENPDTDGVYEAIEARFETPEAEKQWFEHKPTTLTTMTEKVKPGALLAYLALGGFGFFSIDGLLVKKSIFEKSGYFDPDLSLTQDTHIIMKMAAAASLLPGSIEKPVAVNRVHSANRIRSTSRDEFYDYQKRMWNSLVGWSKIATIKTKQKAIIHLGKIVNEFLYRKVKKGTHGAVFQLFFSIFKFTFRNNPILSFFIRLELIKHVFRLLLKKLS